MGYTSPSLEVRKVAGGWNAYAPSITSLDDLTIYPNSVNTTARLGLDGSGAVHVVCDSGAAIQFEYDAGSVMDKLFYGATDITHEFLTNRNCYLKTQGTGLVKFGTRTATGDVACNGYITILDAAGNTVKLMTTA